MNQAILKIGNHRIHKSYVYGWPCAFSPSGKAGGLEMGECPSES